MTWIIGNLLYFQIKSSIDWSPITRNEVIDHDLEATPLKILTDTALGINDFVNLLVMSLGKIRIDFKHKRFSIDSCGSYGFVNLPEDLNKEWTISKTKEALTILCNGVEVLNLVYDEVDIYCTRLWSKATSQIRFMNDDSASDNWRPLLEGKITNYIIFLKNVLPKK